MKVPIEKIVVSKDNPRQSFDEEGLRRLGESIKTHGQIQPIVVRQRGSNYELVVGERRLRACALVGIKEIDAEVREIDDSMVMELRLIENTQREDLSDAEKGDAVLSLWANYDKYETLKDVVDTIHASYGTVLYHWIPQAKKLSDKVKTYVARNDLTNEHAYQLMKYSHSVQNRLANIIIRRRISSHKEVLRRFTKLYDENPNANLDELANKVLGIETVVIPKTELTKEQLENIKEKSEFAKIHRIRKKRSKPITKEQIKKKTDFKFEQVKVIHGTGKVKPPSPTIKPTILGTTKPDLSKPDWAFCRCSVCSLFGQHCKGRGVT